jgi:DNA helicase IV
MGFIKDIILKIKLASYSPKINNQLSLLENKIPELKLKQKEVLHYKTIIPNEYVDNIRNDHKGIIAYIKSGDFSSFDPKLSFLYLSLSTKKIPEKFQRFESIYMDLCNRYNTEITELEKGIEKTNQRLKPFYDGLHKFLLEIENAKQDYIPFSALTNFIEKYKTIYSFFEQIGPVTTEVKRLNSMYPALGQLTKEWNENFVEKALFEHRKYFNNIDGKSLDDQQRRAIVIDEDNNLIVAGAGSGKTLTVSGKVKYLVEKKGINPEEILLVTFTKKAAEEMEERIKRRLQIDVEVKTFHKIGISIIGKTSNKKPDVVENAGDIIKGYFDKELYDNPEQLKKMIEFFGYYLNIPKDLEEFNSLGECYDHHKHMDFQTLRSKYEERLYIEENSDELKRQKRTLNGEKVKSLEEVMIANFLFLNGIDYIYEQDYQYSTSTEFYRQYKPDFFLTDYNMYIEHFGITRDHRAPWLSEIEEKKYIEGIQWKRSLHDENQTILIETYSYLNKEGKLLETLRTNLLGNGVKFREVDFIDIFNKIYDTENSNHFNEFIKFASTFINLFKSNGYGYEKFEELISSINKRNDFLFNRTKIFLEIVKPVYLHYESVLKKNNQIDFNDMINKANTIISSGAVNFPYKYIIIDEYQDISMSRFQLIKAIRSLTKSKIMAVGDDWQSIYRFAGSDINIFTDFQHHFGFSKILKIEKTYRNSQELINIAGQFVMENPKQMKKELTSNISVISPIRAYGYMGEEQLINAMVNVIDKIVESYGANAEIMLLGRNNFDIKFINKYAEFKLESKKNVETVFYSKYPNLNMFFMTVHKSKGLEAENVIIINAANSLLGFPNRISDDPILSLVLTDQDDYVFAEERRLFYVALTRTKNITHILAPEIKRSVFVKELIDKQNIEYEQILGNTTLINNPSCPRCIEGYLIKRENSINNQQFIGCSNYPQCEYTLKDIKVMDNQVVCPRCKGYMVIRKSSRGEFYGCTNYPDCRGTVDPNNLNRIESERILSNIKN